MPRSLRFEVFPLLLVMFKKYRWDIGIIALAGLAVLITTITHHGDVKPFTRAVATISPVVFTVAALALLAVLGSGKRRGTVWAKRFLMDLAFASLFIPLSMLKAETLAAPFELLRGADAATVTGRIASNNDLERYRAWARLMTMSSEDQDEVAKRSATLLTSESAGTRKSARLTLDVALRRHLIAALMALSPNLNEYLRLGGPAANPPVETPALAAAFAQDFVKGNVTAIRKALDPDQRGKLPAGGLEALMLALAADDDLGTPFLRSLAVSDDAVLNPLARDVLNLKDHPTASH